MLPLKAFVKALQNALRYPDGLVLALPFLERCLEHHYPRLVLEKASDCLNVELPKFRYLSRGIVSLGRGRCFHRIARFHKCVIHRYLAPFPCGSANAGAFASRRRPSCGTLLGLSGTRIGG